MISTKTSLVLLIIALIASSAYAMRNPSATYCLALGYNYMDTTDEAGNAIGLCEFPGNNGNASCDAWSFVEGKCGMEYSYCAKQGYQQKKGTSGKECNSGDLLAECLLCILPNGMTAEVTSLMDLNVSEGVCGDGACTIGETPENCPQDCPATTTTMEEISTTLEEITTLPIATTLPTEATTQPQGTSTIPEETTQPSESTTLPETTTTIPGSPKTGGGLMDYLPYVVLIVILLAALFIIKKKRDEKKVEKEKEEFEKWKQEKERAGGTV